MPKKKKTKKVKKVKKVKKSKILNKVKSSLKPSEKKGLVPRMNFPKTLNKFVRV